MKNSRNLLIFVFAAAVVAGGLWVVFRANDEEPKHNWEITLEPNGKEPYDLSVFYETVKKEWGNNYNEIPAKYTLEKYRPDITSTSNGVYFFVGKNIYLTQEECDFLSKFVFDGGTVFISANGIPNSFIRDFGELSRYSMERFYDDSVRVYFENEHLTKKDFKFVHKFRATTTSVPWYFFMRFGVDAEPKFESATDPESSVVNITKTRADYSDFMMVEHGAGKLYLHANPVFFSNYYLKSDSGRQYLKQVLQHMPDRTLWMDMSSVFRKPDGKTGDTSKSIYDFIASDKSLQYAWWLLLCGIAAFLFLGGRRRQRNIPVLAKPGNNTLELIGSLGHFYLKERNNVTVFRREWNQFMSFVRNNIRLQLNAFDEENARLLSEKSGVQMQTIHTVFAMYEKYRIFSELTTNELIETNKAINDFYQEYKNKYGK